MNRTEEKIPYIIEPEFEALFTLFLDALHCEYKITQSGKKMIFFVRKPYFDDDLARIILFYNHLI